VAAATEDVADPDAVVGRAEGRLGKEDDGRLIAQGAGTAQAGELAAA
jgi:hypothetical protein